MTRWPNKSFTEVPDLSVAEELASQVRVAVYGSSKGPLAHCDVRDICSLGGFRVKTYEKDSQLSKCDGILVSSADNRFDIGIYLDNALSIKREITGPRRQRIRFTISHEIGHSFFYDRSWDSPKKLTCNSKKEEEFCDRFASSLLMPLEAIEKRGPSLSTIVQISEVYDTSLMASSHAIWRRFPWMSIILLRWKPKPNGTEPAYRVEAAWSHKFIPLNKSFQCDALRFAELNGQGISRELVSLGGLKGNCEIQTMMLRKSGYMLASVSPVPEGNVWHDKDTPNTKPLHGQLSLPICGSQE